MVERYASQHRGVYRSGRKSKPWVAMIRIDGKYRNLGRFSTEDEAAQVRHAAVASLRRDRRRRVSAVGCYDDLDLDWVEIELTQGKWSKVNRADFHLVIGQCWRLCGGYAICDSENKTIRMHRVILGLSDDDTDEVDHANGDGLDNRRANLRLADKSHNQANRAKQRLANASSEFKGVSRVRNRWVAQIMDRGRNRHLGTFDTEEEAARAYNVAATDVFGEFARLNEVSS